MQFLKSKLFPDIAIASIVRDMHAGHVNSINGV